MRISLEVDNGQEGAASSAHVQATEAGAAPATGTSGTEALGADANAGPWSGEQGTGPSGGTSSGEAATVADGHASLSSPPADTGGGATEAQEPPDTGEGDEAAQAEGDLEQVEGYERPDEEQAIEMSVAVDEQLRDIGEASFGAAPEAIIGTDDRVQITGTSVYAWRVHCSLRITAADGSQWIGTGWFCGPRTVITAGHCVYIKNSGVPGRDGWVRSITVIPGRNGTSQPYGAVVSGDFRTVAGWANNGNQEYDYGAILLPTPLGNTTGWLGFGAYSDSTLLASTANISGYPGDKPAGTQWYHARRVTSVGARKVYYDVDTFGGQSGSAVYRIVDGGRYAVAIHAYGGATSNSGTRITGEVHANLNAWRA
jgi:glutamyl endopeptidase